MRKLLFAILTLGIFATVAIYLLIPRTLLISEAATLACVADAAARTLEDETAWQHWWPGKIKTVTGQPAQYQLDAITYSISQKTMNNFALLINDHGDTIHSYITLLTLPQNLSVIKWQCSVDAGSTPWGRWNMYRKAVALKANMDTIVGAAKQYLSRAENIYGFTPNEASTADTALMTIKSFSISYPSTAFVYGMIDELKIYCTRNQATISGVPMLNITAADSGGYAVMTALPVKKTVPGNGTIAAQKMIPGKFIIADIAGGPGTISRAHQQLINYFRDYSRTSMAIPFEYLITDRLKQPDTSKWLTRIYSPVY